MTPFNNFFLRTALTTVSLPRRFAQPVCLLAWICLLSLPAMLTAPRAAYAAGQMLSVQANVSYVPGHIYLNAPDGTPTDVTDAYVQTGSVYDAQKGYAVQIGYVTQGDGSSLDVTVDFHDGDVDDWGGHHIGFVCQSSYPYGSASER